PTDLKRIMQSASYPADVEQSLEPLLRWLRDTPGLGGQVRPFRSGQFVGDTAAAATPLASPWSCWSASVTGVSVPAEASANAEPPAASTGDLAEALRRLRKIATNRRELSSLAEIFATGRAPADVAADLDSIDALLADAVELPPSRPLPSIELAVIGGPRPLLDCFRRLLACLASGCGLCLATAGPADPAALPCCLFAAMAAEANWPAGRLEFLPGIGAIPQQVSRLWAPAAAEPLLSGQLPKALEAAAFRASPSAASSLFVIAPPCDLGAAADDLAMSLAACNGQLAETPKRLLLQESLAGDFLALLSERMSRLRASDRPLVCLDAGPPLSASSSGTAAALANAIVEGASVAAAAAAAVDSKSVGFIAPTVLTGPQPSDRLLQTPHAGPLAVALVFRSAAEALKLAAAGGLPADSVTLHCQRSSLLWELIPGFSPAASVWVNSRPRPHPLEPELGPRCDLAWTLSPADVEDEAESLEVSVGICPLASAAAAAEAALAIGRSASRTARSDAAACLAELADRCPRRLRASLPVRPDEIGAARLAPAGPAFPGQAAVRAVPPAALVIDAGVESARTARQLLRLVALAVAMRVPVAVATTGAWAPKALLGLPQACAPHFVATSPAEAAELRARLLAARPAALCLLGGNRADFAGHLGGWRSGAAAGRRLLFCPDDSDSAPELDELRLCLCRQSAVWLPAKHSLA
ncbi:hypothetical protein BOX15_Mlig023222g1, partial [Macrostomum lignano]